MLKTFFPKLVQNSRDRKLYIGTFNSSKVSIVTGKKLDYSIWSSLFHSNVCGVLKVFEENEEHCVVYPVAGRSIHDLVKLYGRYSEDMCWKVLEQMLDVVRYLHDLNVLHNNLTSKVVYMQEKLNTIKIGDLLDATIGNYSKLGRNGKNNTRNKEISRIGIILFEMISGSIIRTHLTSEDLKALKCSSSMKSMILQLITRPATFDNLNQKMLKANRTPSVSQVKLLNSKDSWTVIFDCLGGSLSAELVNCPDRMKVEMVKEYLCSNYSKFSLSYCNLRKIITFHPNKAEFLKLNSSLTEFDHSNLSWILLEVLYYESVLYSQ
eukprot:NODE_146_length_17563_cov_0.253321.p5 type:complete len:322 gc:universal NODE_146_length_17563_cov_0.253321:16501-17466(+)